MRPLPFKEIRTLGDRLRLLRTLFGLTQDEVASQTGLGQGTLTKLERDVYEPEAAVLERIGQLFSAARPYVVYGDPPLFIRRWVFCELLLYGKSRGVRQHLRDGGLAAIIHHLATVSFARRCFRSSTRPGIYVMPDEGSHHIVLRTDDRDSVDRALSAAGVLSELLPDEVASVISRLYDAARGAGDRERLGQVLSEITSHKLQAFFGVLGPDDMVTRATILAAAPRWRLILEYCRQIGAREADLADALKAYPTWREIG